MNDRHTSISFVRAAICVFIAFAFCLAFGTAARAQTTTTAPNDSTPAAAQSEEVSSNPASDEEKIATLRKHRDELRKGGPIAGIVLSSVGVAAGATLLATGVLLRVGDSDAFSDSARKAGNGIAAAGSVIVVGSIVGLIFASRRLKEQNKLEDSIDREIRALQANATRVSFARGAPQNSALLRF